MSGDAPMPAAAGQFDVVILGGGSAGCVLAARLSEDPATRVLLVEAGPDLQAGAVPAAIASPYPGRAYFNGAWTWPALTVRMGTDASNEEARVARPYEQARILGGGSSINGIGANRGSPFDYDEWAAEGAAGWSWSDVLPYFRKLERDLDFAEDAQLHGGDGPLPVRRIPRPEHTAFARAAEEEFGASGYPGRADQNGAWEDGVFPIAVNLDEEGKRASVATAYLTPEVRRRANLAIWTGAAAERMVLRGGRAIGARVRRPDGTMADIGASLVVVSAGALHSPALLLRSGIGPAQALADLGIEVAARRDGVGRNLLEHPSIGVSAFLAPEGRLPPGDRYHIQAILRWTSRYDWAAPGDMHMAINTRSGWHAVGHRIGTLFTWVNKSYSRGIVELASPDPTTSPLVDFRLLSDERDLVRLADSFRFAAAVLTAPRLAGIVVQAFPSTYSARVKRLLRPTALNGMLMAIAGPLMDAHAGLRARMLDAAQEGTAALDLLCRDEDALRAHLKRHVGGVWHPCGTCRLGAEEDPGAVCDPMGRVIGVDGLMVCDASVMPTIPCANLNVPVLMIAEKTADAIKAQRRA
jgi:5-(hydroxymethyl)furfural/furfural oxidase